ncbi:MAG: hypothetical protein Q4C65_05315 [Eubacteriales bacterium]|nr:hypothetical protein [Eubacteriales bacterium]
MRDKEAEKKETEKKETEHIRRTIELLEGGRLSALLALYAAKEGDLPEPENQQERQDPEDEQGQQIQQGLELLARERLAVREEKGYRLTALGRELEPVIEALERFGRLYGRACRLDCAEEPSWKAQGEGTALPEGGKRKEKPAADKRHGLIRTADSLLFFNPHPGYGDWYFWGRRTEQGADIWLITGKEYEHLAACAGAGKALREEDCCLYLKIFFPEEQLCPEQETFYTAVEEAVIRESLRE